MKTTNQILNRLQSTALTFFAIALLATSCKKTDNLVKSESVTEDEAAEVMIQSMSQQSGGLVLQTEATAETVSMMSYECGKTEDTTIVRASAGGASITYNFQLDISKTLVCSMGWPQRIEIGANAHTTYSGPRMSSDDSSKTSLIVSGFEQSTDHFILTLNSVRKGSQQSKIWLRRSFTSELTLASSDILVDKSTGMISSGTIAVIFKGKLSTGENVLYEASISLSGNKKGVITFKNGSNYNFSWE